MDKPARKLETILIVEDDAGLARLQKLRLERSGFAIFVAGTFEEALATVQANHIDLVLLDYQLPGGRTGLEVQAELAAVGYDLPVVVVTGHHDEATVIKALRAGVRDFITKSPTYLDYLVDVVERVLRQVRTERQLDESQALLSGVVSSTIDAIMTLDAETRVTFFNSAAERMFGCSAAEAIGRRLDEFVLVDESRLADAIAALGHSATGAAPRWEFSGRRTGGEEFPVEASLSTGEVGGGLFHTLVLRDLTEQKRLQSTLQVAEQRLRQKQKLEAVGSLAGGVAHEFNNLLQAILGYTNYAMRGLPAEDQRYRDLEQVVKAGQRAATLTRQLLSFSRRQELQRSNVSVKSAIEEFVAMVRPLLGEDVELTTSCSKDAFIHVDSGEFQQVLLNLAINARDAMPQGGRLSIACEPIQLCDVDCLNHSGLSPGAYAMLTISDTGEGIPEHVRERIFEPFFTTKEVGKGTGLGLAMVHGMVSQHQGAVHVYSEVGKGTTFRIYLPLVMDGTLATAMAAAGNTGPRGTETILIAEDEPMVRSLAVRILEDAGYRTCCAVDGEDAMRVFLEHAASISLVLIDVVMPKMGGVQLYHRLKEFGLKVPVIFCTGHAPNVSEAEVICEQRLPLVQKPYASSPLLRCVRQTLDTALADEASKYSAACTALEGIRAPNATLVPQPNSAAVTGISTDATEVMLTAQ